MNYQEFFDQYGKNHEILSVIDLDFWNDDYDYSTKILDQWLDKIYRPRYQQNQRVIFCLTKDYYTKDLDVGLILRKLQVRLNEKDISNCFVTLITTNPNIVTEQQYLAKISSDPNHINVVHLPGSWTRLDLVRHPYSKSEAYQYGSLNPVKISLQDLSARQQYLLTESKRFCMYPWIHLHAYPTGEVFPCCHAEMSQGPVGSARQSTLKDLWNSDGMKSLRQDMLTEKDNAYCTRCYEQEKSGFFGGRQSANKHHGHLIHRIEQTQPNGHLEEFHMTYWDIRFSNLCNLRCRSCGHIFSSQWYQDQAKLAGPDWKKQNQVLNYAGRHSTDMWEQLIEHIDYVEQIYFAGGEPLLMEEHYNILDELERRNRFDVRLIYNTNFTEVRLKDRLVFDYWKKFKSVAVGASLDASGPRGEYIRKGTDWAQIEANRRMMQEICPEVDFYVSPTVSIMNVWHLPDFHREWTDKGLISAKDLNVNVLQDPLHYRIDIAPADYKRKLYQKYQEHLQWLRPQDTLQRATQGFEAVLNFMMSTDNTHLIDQFWRRTHQLDDIRNEKCLDVLPELKALT